MHILIAAVALLGLAMAGSDNHLFPFINVIGLCVLVMAAKYLARVLARKECRHGV